MDPNLAELLHKKENEASAASAIDWDHRRGEYLAAMDGLYKSIAGMLAEPIGRGTVKLMRRPKQLTENYIGTYSADDLILTIGDEQVRFSPRGRNIVGADGRVDVVGERREATLVLEPGAQWGFVEARQPSIRVAPLNESTFADVLKLVMRD